MINLIDTTDMPVLDLSTFGPLILPDAPGGGEGGQAQPSCMRCEAYRPDPQLSGNLQVDPEIHLPSPGMNVDLAYFYNGTSTANGPFGYGRTLSTNLTAQASGSPALVTMTRGSGAMVNYQDNGSGTFVSQTPGNLNTLVKDTTDSLWKETTPDGKVTAYPLNTTGQVTSITYAQDAIGNTHSFSYSSGLLQTLQDAAGRLVTFGYSGGLLQSIEDWAGRVTTFAYNTTLASPLNLLTTVTGPTGCQTAYQHTTFTSSTGSSNWLLSGIVDPNGFGTSYSYDQQKRVVSRTLAGVGATTFLYQPSMQTTVDATGNSIQNQTSSSFGLLGTTSAVGAVATFTRNSQNQETSRQNALGAITTTLYDAAGNVSGIVNPLGQYTTLTHDSYNNPLTVQTADGAVWTQVWGYSSSSFDTTGAKRRLQVSVDPLGNRTSYSFTGQGLVASVQNAVGVFTTYGYDSFGVRHEVVQMIVARI